MTCARRTDLGAYVLGGLDPAERARLEGHLDGCPACREELAEMAPLPGLLARATLQEAAAGPPAPPPVERLLAQVRRERQRRRVLAAAAAVAVLAGGGVGAYAAFGPEAGPPALVAAGPTGVHARVTLADRPSGTVVQLTLRGVPPGEHCRLVAVGRDGSREVAGSWEANYEGAAEMTGSTSMTRAALDRLVVETLDGRTLVTVPVAG